MSLAALVREREVTQQVVEDQCPCPGKIVCSLSLGHLGELESFGEDCIFWADEAIRRNPFLPDFCLSEKGFSEYFAKRYDNAIKTFGRMLAPGLWLNVMGCNAACYAQLGRDEEARIAAAEFRDRAKAERKSDWDAESWQEYWSNLFVLDDPEPNDRLLDGLRKAGLP